MSRFQEFITISVDPATARVYEEGWQSWSPSCEYGLADQPFRPTTVNQRVMGYRFDLPPPADGFVGEGLLAVRDSADGPVHVFAAQRPEDVPSIRASVKGNTVTVTTDGHVDHVILDSASIQAALEQWADGFAATRAPADVPVGPRVWCSWYQYFTDVTEADIVENLDAMAALDLPYDVVQIDDGYQSEIGDWLTYSDRFTSLHDIAQRVIDAGRRPGIWVAPFLVGERSTVARDHPEWLVPGITAGRNWNQGLHVLDSTHPGAADYLTRAFSSMRAMGIDYFKIDFVYAGALTGRRHADMPALQAYREGLDIIRAAIGDAYLVGCGAPLLASVGKFDAARVSPDIAPEYDAGPGNENEPSQRSARITGEGRRWMNGRFWRSDPDCFIARPAVERREEWVDYCLAYDGLRSTSDRLAGLDEWGLARTREFLDG